MFCGRVDRCCAQAYLKAFEAEEGGCMMFVTLFSRRRLGPPPPHL
jgi:hypothetical protein